MFRAVFRITSSSLLWVCHPCFFWLGFEGCGRCGGGGFCAPLPFPLLIPCISHLLIPCSHPNDRTSNIFAHSPRWSQQVGAHLALL